ncbi:MAG: sigma-54 dependent transcriptional regulator [Methanothrix sp.]|nr:sigma-54 dependent transcriptional regulator [Methanothrix sp.]
MIAKVCLIEDDPIMGESLHERLLLEGFACDWHRTGAAALERIGQEPYAAVVSDIRLPDGSGETIFRKAIERNAHAPPFVFVTAYGAIDRAVELLKLGAADYVTKPFDVERLIAKLRVLAGVAEGEPVVARGELGTSAAARRVEELLPRISERADTVLVTGESGVGKERVAQILHRLADAEGRAPFIAINCAAVSESLLEAELFGHERGAFTGAIRTRRGVFEQAEGGTLFLDEIGEMTPAMQAKLLRAIQEREIVRVGGDKRIPVRLRLVCATNRDLQALVDDGRFRRDLFYRINVIHVRLPPLRERRDDIRWFARMFLAEKTRGDPNPKRLSVAAESALLAHPWPGNIRELRHAIERACILSKRAVIEPGDLFEEPGSDAQATLEEGDSTLADYLQRCERYFILETLERHGWQIGASAKVLGISRKSLWERMRRLAIAAPDAQDGSSRS